MKQRNKKLTSSKAVLGLGLVLCLLASLALPLIPVEPVAADGGPELEWHRTFGGSNWEVGYCVQQTSDGGQIIVGTTLSFGAGGSDAWLIKTDANGNEQWNKTFGGPHYDYGLCVRQTSDGSYVIAGSTVSYGAGDHDVWLIKTDSDGNELWNKTFGGSLKDRGWSMRETLDGGYIIVGWTESFGSGLEDVWLIKTDSDGNEQWNKTFGGSLRDEGCSVEQTSDGGYIIGGQTQSYGVGGWDMWLIKTDSNGNELWSDTFGGSGDDPATSVRQTSDGGYVVAGQTDSYGAGSNDVWLIKTDSNGNEQWNKPFGGSGDDRGKCVEQTSDGGYIVTGVKGYVWAAEGDAWLIKTDSSGNEQWSQTFSGSGEDYGLSVQQTSDGSYIVAGYTKSDGPENYDVWLLKVSNPPNQPSNTSPSNGATGLGLTPTLQSSAFSDPDTGDTHAASHWQITGIAGDYSSPVFDGAEDASNLTSISIPGGTLDYNTTYYWHVRHQDNHGAWSNYSTETSFTTLDALADTAWPMFRHDPQHTGRSPYTGPEVPELKWSYTTGDSIGSSPAIGTDGTIYVGSYDGKLYAINPDGTVKWSYMTGDPVGDQIRCSPAIGSDGTIYVGSCDMYAGSYSHKLYAIDSDGSLKWSYATGADIHSCPAIGADGTIYVGSFDSKVYAINPDGSLKWSYATEDFIYSSPAIAIDGTIYVGSHDNRLYAIDPDGSLKWSYSTGHQIRCSPAIGADGTIYMGSLDDNLYAINPNGSLKWSYATENDIVSSPAIGADGTIYVGSLDKNLYAINPNGSLKWSYDTGNVVVSSPAIDADGVIYVGSGNGKLYAVDSDGFLKWSYATEDNIQSSPAIGADGTIYVGSSDGKLYAIGAAENQPPNQPSNTWPLDGATGVTLPPILQSSAFSDPDSGDTHAASQWQISTARGDYSSPVFDSGTDPSNLTSITVPSGILTNNTTYYWHVRHQDNHDDWSAWSEETQFTTEVKEVDGVVDDEDESDIWVTIGAICFGLLLFLLLPTWVIQRIVRRRNIGRWRDEGYDF